MVDLNNYLETKNTNDNCPICLENIQITYILKCSHIFHTNCLEKWTKDNNSCPLCRKELIDQVLYQKIKKIENSNSLNSNYDDVHYVVLDMQERNRFATGSHEYLIEQLRFTTN